MNAWKRFLAIAAAALFLLSPLIGIHAIADEHIAEPVPDESAVQRAEDGDEAVLTEEPSEEPEIDEHEHLLEQIRETYKNAKKASRVKSFKGKCGKYVNRQLVLLGINKKYIACNGNKAYDIYAKKSQTTGGYKITAYRAKKYTLKEALEAIAAEDPHARNILVGFQRGTSKAGRRYGHVLFIHGIEDDMVYFSDSFAQKIDDVRYKEGEPIVCSIETFAKLYRKYKLDGVIHFG
jgi:hypothetical protein